LSEKAQKREVCVAETTEREKREILEQFLVLFGSSAFELFRFLFIVSALLFSPTQRTQRGPLKTTTTHRERGTTESGLGERAERAFLVVLFNCALLLRAFFFLCFPHKTNRRFG
jgi:hypothetical protein|tara:strand:- start:218 stop:559 length:342 start_codon:yes stop_codon:yes gene_type:complete